LIASLVLSFFTLHLYGQDQDTPASRDLQVTITGVRGQVQVRTDDDQPWQTAQAGMTLGPGAEFRTGPRSGVQFHIEPDQTITLDRLGRMKVLTAIEQAGGKVQTDLGMPYGRTRYQIEASGAEYASTIHTTSSALTVRGSEVGIQNDFHGFAWSNEHRAWFDPFNFQEMTFDTGGEGDSRFGSPGEHRKDQDKVDPRDDNARDDADDDLLLQNPDGQFDFQNDGFGSNRELQELFADRDNSTISFQTGMLEFELGWNNVDGDPGNALGVIYDLDLFVVAPGETQHVLVQDTLSFSTQTIVDFLNGQRGTGNQVTPVTTLETTGGFFTATDNGFGATNGTGIRMESVEFPSEFANGNYLVGVNLTSIFNGANDDPANDVTYQIKASKTIQGFPTINMTDELIDFVILSESTATHTINVPTGQDEPSTVGFVPVPGRQPPQPFNP
jgi:hypothetical protein